MKFKKKSFYSFSSSLLTITSIAIISFMGVSYAVLTNDVEIITSISTAKMNPIFCSNYHLDENHGSSNLVITPEDDNHTFQITGDIMMQGNNGNDKNNPGYEALLDYCIKNDGTVPIKFIGDNGTIQAKINGFNKTIPVNLKDNKDNGSLSYEIEILSDDGKGEFKITLNQQNGILNVGDSFYSKTVNPKLQIETTEPGDYSFEIELPFILWNGSSVDYKSWKETLIVKGDITIKEPIDDSSNIDNITENEPIKDPSNIDNITENEPIKDPSNINNITENEPIDDPSNIDNITENEPIDDSSNIGNITVEELVKDPSNIDNITVDEPVDESSNIGNITVNELISDFNNK